MVVRLMSEGEGRVSMRSMLIVHVPLWAMQYIPQECGTGQGLVTAIAHAEEIGEKVKKSGDKVRAPYDPCFLMARACCLTEQSSHFGKRLHCLISSMHDHASGLRVQLRTCDHACTFPSLL